MSFPEVRMLTCFGTSTALPDMLLKKVLHLAVLFAYFRERTTVNSLTLVYHQSLQVLFQVPYALLGVPPVKLSDLRPHFLFEFLEFFVFQLLFGELAPPTEVSKDWPGRCF